MEEDGKFSYLAEDSDLNAGLTDFTDAASILRRHKKIVESI